MERDNILGALIGLVGATSNSGKTADTDRIVAEAVLAVAKYDDKKSKDEINEVIRKIHDRSIVSPRAALPVQFLAGIPQTVT